MHVTTQPRPWRWAPLVLMALAGAMAAPVVAQTQVGKHRLLHWFHFEEQAADNFEPMPRYWFAIGRPPDTSDANFLTHPLHRKLSDALGFPIFNEIGFDTTHAHSGEHSFRMQLDGGSAGAYLQVGALPAVPSSDYMVAAAVRTTDLDHARVYLAAYFVDSDGRRIASSEVRSRPIASPGGWSIVRVKLMGDHEDAAWIGLEIRAMQPQFDPEHPLGKHRVLYQDVKDAVWVDDVAIWQLPRLVVRTQSDVNILRAPQRPTLTAQVRDLSGRRLVAELAVHDHDRKLIDRATRRVGAGAPSSWSWTPRLERYGWYAVTLSVRDDHLNEDTPPIAQTRSSLLFLPEGGVTYRRDRERFVVAAEGLPDDQLALVPQLMRQSQLGGAVLSTWRTETARNGLDDRLALLDELIQQLVVQRTRVTLSLDPLPAALLQETGMDGSSQLSILAGETSHWRPWLGPVLMGQGQRVHRWKLGSTREANGFQIDDLPEVLAEVADRLRGLTPSPQLVLPWRAYESPRRDMTEPVIYDVDVPPSVQPRFLEQSLEPWRNLSGARVQLHLREPNATEMSQARRVDDFARRLIHAWKWDPAGVSLSTPWAATSDRGALLHPDPLLGVFAEAAARLSGRTWRDSIPIRKGIGCMIFDGPAGGMLAMWSDSAVGDRAVVEMYLGEEVVAIDVWGNRQPVPMVNGKHRVKLSTTPIFIEGIDPELAQMRAAFVVDRPLIESEQVRHERQITLHNPWPRTISGKLLLLRPDHWNIQPKRVFFSIPAGQTRKIGVNMMFPISELAGPKTIVARADFTADHRYDVELSTQIEVGLTGVDFDASLTLEPNADDPGVQDVVVTQLITNLEEQPVSLYAFVNLRGFPREERLIAQLQGGESIMRRFRIIGAGEAVREFPVRVGLRELSGPAMLNKRIEPGE